MEPAAQICPSPVVVGGHSTSRWKASYFIKLINNCKLFRALHSVILEWKSLYAGNSVLLMNEGIFNSRGVRGTNEKCDDEVIIYDTR